MKSEAIQLNGILINKFNIKEFTSKKGLCSWEKDIFFFLHQWFDESANIEVQTSGSTGTPKNILLPKTIMRSSAQMTNAFFQLHSSKTALLCLPISYIAGKMMVVRAIVGGFNLISVEPKANPFEQLQQHIDFTAITPYQLTHSIQSLADKQIENIIVGGGKVSAQLAQQLSSLSSIFYETYGMTETASHIALRCLNGSNKTEYFKTLDGVNIRRDERECLVVEAKHLLDEEIITNDLVELKNQNEFRWLGRIDSVINSGGIKIMPELVEKKIEGILTVAFFISSVPDEILENKLVLVIEHAPFKPDEMQQLEMQLKQILNKYECPKSILFCPQFERSVSTKILKSETLTKLLG